MPTTSGPSSPGEAFERAKDAMARGDWNAFYATLDQQDLLTLLRNGLTSVVSHGHVDEAFREVCAHAGYPLDSVEDALTQMGVAVQSGEDVQVWAKEYRARMDRGFRVVADLPVFAAEVERHFRRLCGGGSVSASLFEGESLRDVEIDGDRAWGVRHDARGEGDPIGFVRKHDTWYVRLLARRRQR